MKQGARPDEAKPAPAAILASPPPSARPDRWRASAWLLWRDDARGSALAGGGGGQLGGSQAGLRIERDVAANGRSILAAYMRLTSALNRPYAQETAIGLSWQPDRAVPLRISGERRIALGDGARNAFALMAVGGIGPVAVANGLAIEAYGQAGMVGLRHWDAFADGRASLTAALPTKPFRAGIGVSGGAQPGVARMDIGPLLEARFRTGPVGHGAPVRMMMEWRERVAGSAVPGSGPTLTLASDF